MFDELARLNINLNREKHELFSRFINLFKDYNSKVNLISRNDANVLFEKHIYDSLALNLFIKKYNITGETALSDIGTGGGFPSIPLAIYFDNFKITAIDSVNKKINFIKYIKEELKLTNINPVCSRIENLQFCSRSSFDIVTSRALAQLNIITEYALPYLKTGGFFIAYKSLKADEEIENAKNAFKMLNAKLTDKIEYSLPLADGNKRVLLIIKKEKETSPIYPRKNGLIKKNPL